MVDFLMNLIMDLVEVAFTVLPTVDDYPSLRDSLIEVSRGIRNVYIIMFEIPILRSFATWITFLISVGLLLFIYRAFAWTYNAIRGRLD